MRINGVSAGLPSATSSLRSTTPSPSKSAAALTAPSTASTQAAASVSSAVASQITAGYTTTIAGKTYSGKIAQSGGTYEISVPNLPGATVSGSNLQAAEIALTVKIDALV